MILFADAAGADVAAKAAERTVEISLGQAWTDGGALMWVLALVNVLAFAVMIYLWLAHSPKYLVPEALSRIRAAKDPAAEGSRIAERINTSVDLLADIAAIAPLIGLLGTVYGIYFAFSGLDAMDYSQAEKASRLAAGVSKAVVTTIFGLIVAIPSLVAHAVFRRRAASVIAKIELKVEAEKETSNAIRV